MSRIHGERSHAEEPHLRPCRSPPTTILPPPAHGGGMRCRKTLTPARPYACCSNNFYRLTKPSVGPLLQLRDNPARTSRRILEQPRGKGSQFLHAMPLHLRDPCTKHIAVMLTDHATEGLDLMIHAGHHRVNAEEVRQEGLIGRAPVFRFRQKQACRMEGGQGGGAALVMVLGIEGRRRLLIGAGKPRGYSGPADSGGRTAPRRRGDLARDGIDR